MKFKNINAFLLRIILYLPLCLLAHVFDGLQMLLGRVSDGLFDMARSTKQITLAPYVKDIEEAINNPLMKKSVKEKILSELHGEE